MASIILGSLALRGGGPGERRCVMAVGLDILFPGKACKQTPFFSLLLSQRICSDTLLFFTELPCVGRCGAVAFGVKV